jgi:hypothetical protein
MVPKVYELSFMGEAGRAIRAAFPEFVVTTADGITLLRGRLTDQAALHGAIARVESLGLELTDVHLVGADEPDSLDNPEEPSPG